MRAEPAQREGGRRPSGWSQSLVIGELLALRIRAPRWFDATPLPETLRRLAAHQPWVEASPEELDLAIDRAERLWSRLAGPHDTCLYRSLARFAVLRARGHEVRFVMGVFADHGHAWLERAGEPLEELDYPYTVTWSYP
jgi:hypothetical protein